MGSNGFIGLYFGLFALVATVFYIYVGWRIFEKANRAGWKVLIPIYNIVVQFRIIGRSPWWTLAMFIPIVNLIPMVLLPVGLAKSFGKGLGFGIGLLLLAPIFFPILALGSARYEGPAAASDGTAPATT
jgi:uncharacterized membrane protein YhaH (DUF805 family)